MQKNVLWYVTWTTIKLKFVRFLMNIGQIIQFCSHVTSFGILFCFKMVVTFQEESSYICTRRYVLLRDRTFNLHFKRGGGGYVLL